ncbi:MAG: hypothetical protein ACI8Y4_000460 [Candidatus Poriferisodalaceae bacterium]|jgi:hypothetical protein
MSDSSWDLLVAAYQRSEAVTAAEPPVHAPKAAILACSDAQLPP